MAYYIRLLTPSDEVLPLDELQDAVDPDVTLSLEGGDSDSWDQLLLSLEDGTDVTVIERNPVADDESLGAGEIVEFLEEIATCKPESSVRWLSNYLPTVKAIYAFQLLGGTDTDDGREAFDMLQSELWSSLGGIFQADAEGFSNEDGYHILWQFSDSVSGPWQMGLLKDGEWVHFGMELGDRKQREAFQNGEIPENATFK